MLRLLGFLLVVALINTFPNTGYGQNGSNGTATVTPALGTAGDFGTWTVTYTVGSEGVAQGGAIRVQLPDSWHAADRNSGNPLQTSNPQGDHYVSAHSSNPEAQIETTVEGETDRVLVKSARPGLDGRSERYVFVVRATVARGRLTEGDKLSVVYGDTNEGSRGMQAAVIATEPEPIHIAVDATGNREFTRLSDEPTIRTQPGPPARMRLIAPSSLSVGESGRLHAAIFDQHNNLVTDFDDELTLTLFQGSADLPTQVTFDTNDGWQRISFTPTEAGIIRVTAETYDGLLTARSNPTEVTTAERDERIFWGDLHSHSEHSWDGVGNRPFHYARYAANLDFYALTDHSIPPSDGFTRGLADHVWDSYTSDTETAHVPDTFVTLHAYEASFGSPYGHHNVFFRDAPGPLLAPENVTLPQLWKALEDGNALTIPHHTGKFPSPIRWEPHDSTHRRNFEIYSAHGLSEAFNPDHPLAFEQSDFTSPSSSVSESNFAQDVWAHGHHLSTIAASDDHRSQPGQAHWGLTALRAPELSRNAVFQALYDRRTYGTTGARILLEFSVGGHSMGERGTIDSPPQLEIEAHGTDIIERIEILRYSPTTESFKVIHTIRPDGLDVRWSDIDTSLRDDRAIYYVRLRQRGHVRNRVSMAWSSPIWIHRHD